MSLLIEKLTKQRQNEPQPMGFGFLLSKTKAEKMQMLLIADLEADNWEKMADNLKTVDAVILDVTKAENLGVVEKANQIKDRPPAGGWMKSPAPAIWKKVSSTECDFLAFSPSAPVSLTRKEKLGRILEIDISLGDSLLRAVGDLPVDAVINTGKGSELNLTIARLMQIQRVLHLVNKPLLTSIPDNLSAAELQSLWDIGVAGVVVEIGDEKSVSNLTELRSAIDKLELPAFRKKAKTMAILPRQVAETQSPPGHEQEEEDE